MAHSHPPIPTLAALALFCASESHALADVTRVIINDPEDRPIVTNGDISIGLFRATLVLQDYPPIGIDVIENSVRIAFTNDSGVTSGLIRGNDVPFPSLPLQSPSLFADGGLDLLGLEIDASGTWYSPRYESITDTMDAARLQQVEEFGDFQIQDFLDEEMAYIGYASANRTRFGYVQIQRQSLTQWTLIGHAYADPGESIVVEDLTEYIPTPPTPLLFGAAITMTGRRRRVAYVA